MPKDLWKNRRRMAYLSLVAVISIGVRCLSVEVSGPSADVLIAVVYGLCAVIGAYVGFATLDDKWSRGNVENDYSQVRRDSSRDTVVGP